MKIKRERSAGNLPFSCEKALYLLMLVQRLRPAGQAHLNFLFLREMFESLEVAVNNDNGLRWGFVLVQCLRPACRTSGKRRNYSRLSVYSFLSKAISNKNVPKNIKASNVQICLKAMSYFSAMPSLSIVSLSIPLLSSSSR